MRRSVLAPSALALLVTASLACSSELPTEDSGEAEEHVTELKSYWADAKKLDLGDLTRVTMGFASDALNDGLAVGSFAARVETPQVFGVAAEPNKVLPAQAQVKGLETVVTGLGARFGENEIGTEVNKVRLARLRSGADGYYVESAFAIKAGTSHGWSFDAQGFPAQATLGFDASTEIASRVIVATKDDGLSSLVSAPLKALKETRGFVYPRSVDEVRKMKPGESFALRGVGSLGANVGLGLPILVAEPTGGVAYRVLVSGGASAVIGGQVDVQLVRLDGDEVVVDVGVENARATSVRAAISDGWGIKGVCDDGQKCLRNVELAGKQIDLQKLVEKAVEKRLNQYVTFSVQGGASSSSSRVSLSRLRFHLDRGDKAEVNRALEHALRLDVRLAQALYNRDLAEREPAVSVDFDAVRAATTSTRNFGFELLGMNIYHRAVVENSGTFVVQTPEGARAILFDSLNKHGGWFQTEHGFTRIGVAAQTLDPKNPDAFKSEANLFVQTVASDSHLDDDMLIDASDALILAVGGPKALETLDQFGNALDAMVKDKCFVEGNTGGGPRETPTPDKLDEKCVVGLLEDPAAVRLRTEGIAAFDREIANLPADFRKVLHEAALRRIALQSVGSNNPDPLNGPNASITVDYRLDDKALDVLAFKTKDQYRAALREYLATTEIDRVKNAKGATKEEARKAVDAKWGADMDAMAAVFHKNAGAYRLITEAERVIPQALSGKRYATYPLGVRFAVDGGDAKIYESALLESTSHDRAKAASRLFDALFKEADRINARLWDEHTAAFPLLSLVPAKNLEVGLDITADTKSSFFQNRERFQKSGFTSVQASAKGAESSVISAGMFDLSKVITGGK